MRRPICLRLLLDCRRDAQGRCTSCAVKIHELRHTAADTLYRHKRNLVMAQDLLGHESPSTTRRYLHPTREDLAAAMRELELSWRDE